MEPKFAEGKFETKRDCNAFSTPEGTVSRGDGSGTVRVKIVLTKRQLSQMIASIGDGNGSEALEQLLHPIYRRLAQKADSRRKWRPVLHSIPEEL